MTDLKRDEIKYVRDFAKSTYKKDTQCYICGTDEELQFHHFYTMTLLWKKWKQKKEVIIRCVDDILEQREVFKVDHHNEIYNETVTLCKEHHMNKLHKIYGKTPALSTGPKQARWCDKQRVKILGE